MFHISKRNICIDTIKIISQLKSAYGQKRVFQNSRRKTVGEKKQRSSKRMFAGLAPYTGNWTVNEVTHLLKRTMFGAKKADVDYFLTLSPTAAVDELLNNIATPTPPVRDYGLLEDDGVMYDDLSVLIGQTWVNDPNTASAPEIRGQINRRRSDSLKKWWTGLIINQGRSIQEKWFYSGIIISLYRNQKLTMQLFIPPSQSFKNKCAWQF